jgi:hypothetical protein
MGPGERNCWIPAGRACRQTKDLSECKLPGVGGYASEEECLAAKYETP